MEILIIGGTGFIGPFLVRELARMGHSVTIFHRGVAPAGDLPAGEILGNRKDLFTIRPRADVVIDLKGSAKSSPPLKDSELRWKPRIGGPGRPSVPTPSRPLEGTDRPFQSLRFALRG